MKIIDVWICKMRKKLRPYGIEVKTAWGAGYEIPEASEVIARGAYGGGGTGSRLTGNYQLSG